MQMHDDTGVNLVFAYAQLPPQGQVEDEGGYVQIVKH